MTTTAAEGLRNCFFSLNTNKIQMASSTERFANLGEALGEAEIQKLLEDKDSLNSLAKRSTKASRIGKNTQFPNSFPD
jgi:hypothetical protein